LPEKCCEMLESSRLSLFLLLAVLLCGGVNAQKYYHLPKDSKVFTSLSDALKNPESVEYLDLSGKKLKEFPAELRRFSNLVYLDLSSNQIKEIPIWIAELQKIRFLNISRNNIKLIPAELAGLEHLNYLIMRHNDIGYIPQSLCSMVSLKVLDLSSTYLNDIPECIETLATTLEVLNIRYLQMTKGEMQKIFDLLPATKIYYSAGCRCNS
jgi:Leucine-rich repeat (LRR) protein